MDRRTLSIAVLLSGVAATAVYAAGATSADRMFVAKVSQGGMFEVAAGKLAETRGAAQDVRDFAGMEVHDHALVGAKLKAIATSEDLKPLSSLNTAFSEKLDHLKGLSGRAFDVAYMSAMADLHDADGAAFAREATEGGSDAFKSFAAETHVIVQRHIGAIRAAAPS